MILEWNSDSALLPNQKAWEVLLESKSSGANSNECQARRVLKTLKKGLLKRQN